ncbi:MAG: urease accessory protein UreF [Pseudomonadota bacterium]
MTTGIDTAALYRLQTWLSPSFPVGAYTFSHGLEYAIDGCWITDVESAERWLSDLLRFGTGYADLVFVAAGWDADDSEALALATARALAMAASKELLLESTAQGAAFVQAIAASWPTEVCDYFMGLEQKPYSVAVGAIAAAHGVPRRGTLHAYAHAFVSNLISALLRAMPLGQTDGQRLIAALEPIVDEAVVSAASTPLAEVSASTPISDIASMRHENQYTRLFRS